MFRKLSTAAAASSSRDLLPWLPPPKQRPSPRPRRPDPRPSTLTNAAVLKAITDPLLDAKQLLALYTRAARQPGFRHDYPTYKALSARLVAHGRPRAVELLLARMRREGHPCGPGIMLPLIEACSTSGSHRMAVDLFLAVPNPHEKVFSKLLEVLIAADQLQMARGMFFDNVISMLGFPLRVRHFIGLVRVYSDKGEIVDAVKLLDEMAERGLVPDVFCYGSLIIGVCRKGNVGHGFRLLEQMRRGGRQPDLVVWNSLVFGCARTGDIKTAEGIVRDMEESGVAADVVTYNTLVAGICEHRSASEGVKLFYEMMNRHLMPDVITFTTLISRLVEENKVVESRVVLGKMMRMEVVPDAACCRILMKCPGEMQAGGALEAASETLSLSLRRMCAR